MNVEDRLKELKITLPAPPQPAGSYSPVITAGTQAFLSGQISRLADGTLITGKAGAGLSMEKAKEAARAAALNALSVIKNYIGFERVEKLLRVTGYVQAAPDFYEISQVVNGASDLFLEVFGECGVHARSAVGMASLPQNAAVEIELTLLVR